MIPVLFENPRVLAVEKPVGLATVAEGDASRDCLLRALQRERGERLFAVHRLDKPASGVVLFARDAEAHRALNLEFDARRVEKSYVAVVHGIVTPPSGVVNAPIRQYGSGRMGVDSRRGKPSETRYTLLRHLAPLRAFPPPREHPESPAAGGCSTGSHLQGFSSLDIRAATGRRHQVRVHLYHVGHPVVGDPLYGDLEVQRQFPRLMLHARIIAFDCPGAGWTTVEAPLPKDFEAFPPVSCQTPSF